MLLIMLLQEVISGKPIIFIVTKSSKQMYKPITT
jgi:hypothetical protein